MIPKNYRFGGVGTFAVARQVEATQNRVNSDIGQPPVALATVDQIWDLGKLFDGSGEDGEIFEPGSYWTPNSHNTTDMCAVTNLAGHPSFMSVDEIAGIVLVLKTQSL